MVIDGRLDNLNDYISAERSNRYKGAQMKKKNEQIVLSDIYSQLGRLRIAKPVWMSYKWYEKNRRRDLDNISSFGRKVIQDALVIAKVLPDDGWRYIRGFDDSFYVDASNPRIEVIIKEIG